MKKLIYIFVAAFFSLTSVTVHAQTDIYIKVTNSDVIEGESVVKGYEKQIEALDFAQESSGCDFSVGVGSGACKTTTSNFVFDMLLNKGLIGLRKAMYKGDVLDRVDIVFVKSGAVKYEYYKIRLDEVVVTKVTDALGNGSETNSAQVQFSAKKFGWTYTPQDPKTGAAATTPVKFGWDSSTNTEWTSF